ncbi:tripartite motif-containing protein 2-like [Anneissia japonica]|uniref:tripartite motif-containing protein 2-like n=1 Tax=Anneissia japonica TaxID=1529436 RepID=UPI0014255848|nr:tripartite motif-containing protein 2-like [Anneissia japonica]
MDKANSFVDDLLGNTEQQRDQIKCVCENEARYYCHECRRYLCTNCSDHHTKYPLMENHKLQTLGDMQSKAPNDDLSVLQPLMCSTHNKTLKFFCEQRKHPICEECINANQNPIPISEAFEEFKISATELKENAKDFIDNLQRGVNGVRQTDTKLEESKETCLKDIDDIVQELINKINENKDDMKNKVQTIYKNKKRVLNMQISELTTKISDVKKPLARLNMLLKGDKTKAMHLSNRVYEGLIEKLDRSTYTKPNDDGKIYFFKDISSLQWQCNIGNVTETMADHLALKGGEDVTQGQPIVVKVCKTDEYEIDANYMRATWTQPTGETTITQVEEDGNGGHVVTGKCTSPGVCTLDVSVDSKPIRQSPMRIKVIKEGLIHTIKIEEVTVSDVVFYDDNRMLVSCQTKDIFRYKQSGEYIEKVTLSEGVKVNRMYKIKNGGLAFSDCGNKCIALIDMNDQVVKSIGQGKLTNPKGLHVDESNVYVADWNCIFVFNIDNGQVIRRIQQERNVPDITLTKGGNVIVLYDQNSNFTYYNNTKEQCIIQALDNEFKFLKNIVKADRMWKPRGVKVDADDNIIIASEHKLELFSIDGIFIKRIDKEDDGINIPWVLSIANYPRRVIVANKGNTTIQIYNY